MAVNNHLNFFFLLLSLHAIATSAQSGFVSIDCGSSSKKYTDENGITWVSDDSYIYTGENKVAQTPNSVSKVMSTLRVFSTRKKNCYSIHFTKGTHVLVRASFYYGNYDQKSTPPSFNIQLDGNDAGDVDTSSTDLVTYEIIYAVRSDTINLCLAQTQPNQLPFISALEVRTLESTMYPNVDLSNYALLLEERTAFGATNSTRYPVDQYDRIWVVGEAGTGISAVSSTAPAINTSGIYDNPPSIVLQNAVTDTDTTSTAITLSPTIPTGEEVSVYINYYFSEVAVTTQQRSFTVDVDDIVQSDTIIPSYGGTTELSFYNFTATSNTKFSLESTFDSTLPPLINAWEVFFVSDPLTTGTNSADVKQLGLLQTQFPVLAGWTGDPCLPSPYTWDWVNCSSDATPRITALYLNGYGLSGTIPDLSSLDDLQIIDMHNNSLTGDIPASLGKLSYLQELNLADNDLSGTVPTSLSNNNKLQFDVSGNRKLCATDSKSCQRSVPSSSGGTPSDVSTTPSTSSSNKSSSKLPIILGITIPAFIIFIAIVAFLAITYQKRRAATCVTMNAG
ncbi:probable LRR receptor-like serine/threonine-protein kinase At1g05700 [Macadamia integrifolia]|uniref:probable LRR receptor-like serine/threonine-protein kinase At1g05700 n=1 Tax=Macadamia integrifolia TaxID=60698 RepID=UPI001C4F4BBB|nr:probable LRR receptor-like serine/threonine-protein kinase At1g05700 [Macadamia integrifolia]